MTKFSQYILLHVGYNQPETEYDCKFLATKITPIVVPDVNLRT